MMPEKELDFICFLIAALISLRPSPVMAEQHIFPKDLIELIRSSPSSSDLLKILIIGVDSRSKVCSILFTSLIFCCRSSSLTSMTWRRRSAFSRSSSVALKDSIRLVGMLDTNPTVSEIITLAPYPSFEASFLVLVSSVAKSWSLTYVSPLVRRLNNELLPAFV